MSKKKKYNKMILKAYRKANQFNLDIINTKIKAAYDAGGGVVYMPNIAYVCEIKIVQNYRKTI